MSDVINQWMCELCWPEATEHYCFDGPYSLIENKEYWILLGGQGHANHEIITFNHKPVPDPYADIPEDTISTNGFFQWTDLASNFKWHISDPVGGWLFVQDMIKLGYDPDDSGYLDMWLFDYLGRKLNEVITPS